MTTSMRLDDLTPWLREEVAERDSASTIVLAGHYAIFSGGATAMDFLADGEPPAAAADMLAFTKRTWRAACEALAVHRARGTRLLVLVDDIMFVRPLAGDVRTRERLSDALASQYLEATPALPAFHTHTLEQQGLSEADVLKRAPERWTFSERELRVAHVRRLKNMVKAGTAPEMLSVNPDASEVNVTLDGHGAHRLVHAGHTNCAGGYLELLASLHAQGVRTLIALVPTRCLGPITVGTALARRLLALHDLSVVNVAVPDPALDLPVSVMRDGAS